MAIDPARQLPGGIGDFNEAFFDALVRHQIGLLRLSGSVRNDVWELLDATEGDISANIQRRLHDHRGFDTPTSVRRLDRLLKSIRATRAKAWDKVDESWLSTLIDLSKQEAGFTDGILKTTVPVVLDTTLPSPSFLGSIATSRPFQGRALRSWASKMRTDDLNRIGAAVKIGMVQGESSAAIARRVVGTRAAQGRNGVTEITRRQAAAVTRTAVNAISNQSRREFYKANSTLFDKELYTATLDNRTTPICSSLDGRLFDIGVGPIPPLHFQCRSLRVAVIDGEAIGRRPARAFTQRQLLREFSSKEGIGTVTTRAALPRSSKRLFDTFSRSRMRELTGTVPAKVNYQTWLTRQSVAFQDDVLGKTRGVLFRRGELKLDKFVNRAGDQIPLNELARANREAFVAAGLDPEDFI